MKIKTFYAIYYRHRFIKASILLKLYLLITIVFKYAYNLFFLPKTTNLDIIPSKDKLYNSNLNYLFEYFNSDKGDFCYNQYAQPSKQKKDKIIGHGYAKIYENFFNNLRESKLNILEIGSFYGNASAALNFYFRNANIFSADINPDMYSYKGERIKNFYVDSSSRESIQKNIIDKKIKFDVIIEDASHMLKDQVISFFMLFPLVEKDGFFITEEIDFPEKRDDMRIGQKRPDLKTILMEILNKNDFNSEYITKVEKDYVLSNIGKISFFKGNTNEVVIIKKK